MKITKAYGKYCTAHIDDIDGNAMQHIAGLPGFKKWVGRDLVFDPTSANIKHLHERWPDAKWEPDAQPILDDYIRALKESEHTLSHKDADLPLEDDYHFKTKPFDHHRS